jgi:hypothetical protein
LQEDLQFKKAIIFYYSMKSIVKMTTRVPPLSTWHISCIIVDCFNLMICVLNKFKGNWLFNDVSNSTIFMVWNSRMKLNLTSFDNAMDKYENIVFKLTSLASKIKKEVCNFDNGFLDLYNLHLSNQNIQISVMFWHLNIKTL